MKHIIYLFSLLIIFLFVSCKDKGTEPQLSSNDFKVQVKDSLGNPISGVNVYIIYDDGIVYKSIKHDAPPLAFSNESMACYPNPFNGITTTIRFFANENSNVSLKILDYNNLVIKRTLINDFADSTLHHQAGNYQIYFHDTLPYLCNGLYITQYIVKSLVTNKIDTLKITLFKHEVDLLALPNTEACTLSGSDGKFTIPYDKFFLNAQFIRTGPDAPDPLSTGHLTNTSTLVLIKAGYQTFSKKITMNSSSNPEETFVLSPSKP